MVQSYVEGEDKIAVETRIVRWFQTVRCKGLQRIAIIPARNPKREPTRKPPPPSSPMAEKAIITVPQTVFCSILEPSITAPTSTTIPETIPRIADA